MNHTQTEQETVETDDDPALIFRAAPMQEFTEAAHDAIVFAQQEGVGVSFRFNSFRTNVQPTTKAEDIIDKWGAYRKELTGTARLAQTPAEERARNLVEQLKILASQQYDDQIALENAKRERQTVKSGILFDRSADDPKALGGNEALRSEAVERIYQDEYAGAIEDDRIRDLERAIDLQAIDIDYARRLLRIEELLLAGSI